MSYMIAYVAYISRSTQLNKSNYTQSCAYLFTLGLLIWINKKNMFRSWETLGLFTDH